MQTKTKRFCFASGAVLVAALSVFAASGGYAGVVNSPHDFSSSTGLSTKSSTIAPGGVCSACHIPHNAQDNVLWARPLGGNLNYRALLTLDGNPSGELNYAPGFTLQCYDCHEYHFVGGVGSGADFNNPAYNLFQTNHKPQDIAFGFQTQKRDALISTDSGSTMKEDPPIGSYAGYYENAPPFNGNYGASSSLASRTDNVALSKTGGHYFKSGDPRSPSVLKGDKLPCSDCHDPHKWSPEGGPEWQAFFSPRVQTIGQWNTVFSNPGLGSYSTPVGSEYMANPLQSLTDRSKYSQSSRKLCIVCHGTSSDSVSPGPVVSVRFSEVNPLYSNPVPALVRPPAGINEHQSASIVACVSCHLHNSIDASCSMCHGFPPGDTSTVPYPASFTPIPAPGADVDSHARHVGNKQGMVKNSAGPYSWVCGVCHYGSAMGFDTSLGQHQNGKVSVVIQGSWTKAPNGPGGLWDNTNYYNPAFPAGPHGQLDNTNISGGWGSGATRGGDNCVNVYCHSAGRVQPSMALNVTMTITPTTDYPPVRWLSGPVHCNDCHGLGTTVTPDPTYGTYNFGMPSYVSGGIGSGKANSHGPHVIKNGIECSACHYNTVSGVQGVGLGRSIKLTTPTLHVNGLRDVTFDAAVAGASATYDNNTQTCSVSCHGGGSPRWGQTTLTCFSCHAGVESAAKPQPNQGIPSPVDNVQYLSSGHGRPAASGNYLGDLNPPAHFDNVTGSPSDCFVCHALLSKHIGRTAVELTNDPYRLGAVAITGKPGGLGTFTGNFADNVDLLCVGCHGTSTQRAGHDNAAKGTRTIDAQTHAWGITGKKYNPASSAWPVSPWKCVDCHDPHGDGNYKMIRSAINAPTSTVDANAGSDLKGTPKRTSGLDCVVFTSLAGQGANSYASSPAGKGICEVCHTNASLTLFNRAGAGNAGTHASRTGRCTACHVHTAGFKGLGGPNVGQFFDRLNNANNFFDNSNHPLTGLTTADNTLLFSAQNSTNCLGCHDTPGAGHTSDECLKCHYENNGASAVLGPQHMDKAIQLATITGNTFGTSAYTITTIQQYDAWCLQCHSVTTISLGGRFPSASGAFPTQIDPAAIASGRHRANNVGCIFCHAPHGSGNTRLIRNNPFNRVTAAGVAPAASPMAFKVFPNDNLSLGGYGTPQNINYRSRVDANYADSDDENNYCNKACHRARTDASYSKEVLRKRDAATGLYILNASNQKVLITDNVEYTRFDPINPLRHVHLNNEIIPTDDMIGWFITATGATGPSYYKYPGSVDAIPATYNNLTSPLPFFPDYVDGSRDFTNGYLNKGPIRYRFTCSTCHNPHGTPYTTLNAAGGDANPDLRLKRINKNDLCTTCHK